MALGSLLALELDDALLDLADGVEHLDALLQLLDLVLLLGREQRPLPERSRLMLAQQLPQARPHHLDVHRLDVFGAEFGRTEPHRVQDHLVLLDRTLELLALEVCLGRVLNRALRLQTEGIELELARASEPLELAQTLKLPRLVLDQLRLQLGVPVALRLDCVE